MHRIYITGIAGFIGFHLATRLYEIGFFVSGCDNFNPFYSPQLKRARAKILEKRGIQIDELDISDETSLFNATQLFQPTHIIHLAAQAGVRYSLENPKAYIDSNLVGFYSVLEACRKIDGAKLIYASSSSVYGLNQKIPFAEDDPTDQPANLYAATKQAGERIAFSYHHIYNIPMIGLRFFTVYGPWGRPDMAYFLFMNKITKREPIDLYAHGEMARDFTYIDDIVSGIVACIDKEVEYELYNLGNKSPVKTIDLLKTVEEKSQQKAIINMQPAQKGEVQITFADLTKSHRELGYTPKTNLSAGVEKFADWHSLHAEKGLW